MKQLSAEWTDYLTQRTNFPHLKADTVRRGRLARGALRTASHRSPWHTNHDVGACQDRHYHALAADRVQDDIGADDVGHAVCDLLDLGEFVQKGSVRTQYGTTADRSRRVGPVGAGIAGFLCTADQGTVQVPVPVPAG